MIESLQGEKEESVRKAFNEAKDAASSEHKGELRKLRHEAELTIAQIQEAGKVKLENMNSSLATEAEERIAELRKRLGDTDLELRAARDDLLKTKASLSQKETELSSITNEYNDMKEMSKLGKREEANSSTEVADLQKKLEATIDELSGTRAAFEATKESIEAMSNNHRQELEESATKRAREMADLQQAFELEKADLIEKKNAALNKVHELEIEVKSGENGHVQSQAASTTSGPSGIPREELNRMYEAHNLKVHSLEANHRKSISEMEATLEQSLKFKEELQAAAERREMEIHFLTTENEENADRIKRLEDEIEMLTTK